MAGTEAPSYPINVTVALAYLQELQERRPDVYPQLLDLLSEYRVPPRNVDKFRVQVKELLKDEPDLLVRLEGFLPKERGEVETVGQRQDDTT